MENKRVLEQEREAFEATIRGKWVAIGLVSFCSVVFLGTFTAIVAAFAVNSASTHDVSIEEIKRNPRYWNVNWEGTNNELQLAVQAVSEEYYQTHTYIEGETDCDDMAIDIWNILYTQGITSLIVVGNHDIEGEYFEDCDHAWLIICDSNGASFALEATQGSLIFAEDIKNNPSLEQYWEGYFYAEPSSLRADSFLR